MAHKFDRSHGDPYAEAAHQVEVHVFSSSEGSGAGAQEELFDVLSNAIVTALGDVAQQAYRHGLDTPDQMRELGRAVSQVSALILTSYQGEVDPETALGAIEADPRLAALPPENRELVKREVEKTRQIEHARLNARRLPDLFDFVGEMGLHAPDELMEKGTMVLQRHPAPTAGTPESEAT